MLKNQKLRYGIVGGLLCVVLATVAYFWLAHRHYANVVDLIDQLSAPDLSRAEHNQIKVQLMRTMDEMPRDKVWEVYRQLRERRRAEERKTIQAFHAAGEAEKTPILDQAIAEWESGRELMGALRTDMTWGRRGSRGRDRRGEDRRKEKEDDRSEEEIAAERKLRGEYYQAFRARADEQGKGDFRRRRGRGDRR